MYKKCVGRETVAVVLLAALMSIATINAMAAVTLTHPDAVLPPAEKSEETLAAMMREGAEQLRSREFDLAEKTFFAAAEKFPKSHFPLLGLADALRSQGFFDPARAALDKALAIAPKVPAVHIALGRLSFIGRDYQAAEKAYLQALKLDPESFAASILLGELYLSRLKKPDKALVNYRRAVRLNGKDARARFGRGLTQLALGNSNQAIADITAAEKMAPGNPRPTQSLGQIYAKRRQFDKALAAYEKILTSSPKYTPALIGRAEVLAAKGDIDGAINGYEDAVKASPKFAPALLKLAILYQSNKRWTDAENAYRQLIASHPEDPIAYNNLAWILLDRQDDLAEAGTLARKAVSLAPESTSLLDTLGWVHRARGDLDSAASVLRKAATIKGARSDVFYHLGVVEQEMGNLEPARVALEKAISLDAKFDHADDARRRVKLLKTRPANASVNPGHTTN